MVGSGLEYARTLVRLLLVVFPSSMVKAFSSFMLVSTFLESCYFFSFIGSASVSIKILCARTL
jgi:hypothetical protein